MIDTHSHILKEFYDDIDALIEKSKQNGVNKVVNCSDSLNNMDEIIFLSKKYYSFLYSSIGIHPQNVNEYNDEVKKVIEEKIEKNKIIAVGEIGLDYNHCSDNKELQKNVFIEQINIANKYNLPIIVHTRDSIQDCFDILKNNKCKGIIHCYSGSLEMAREFIKLGFYLGIGGVLTFKNSSLYKVIEKIDLEHIVLETDSPFLSPEPNRGKTNKPENVYYVAERISQIKGISTQEVIRITADNSYKIFDF